MFLCLFVCDAAEEPTRISETKQATEETEATEVKVERNRTVEVNEDGWFTIRKKP